MSINLSGSKKQKKYIGSLYSINYFAQCIEYDKSSKVKKCSTLNKIPLYNWKFRQASITTASRVAKSLKEDLIS